MKMRTKALSLLVSILLTVTLFPLSAAAKEVDLSPVLFFGDSTTHGLIRYIVENDGHLGAPVATLSREQVLTPPDGTFYLRNLPTAKIRYKGQDLPLAKAFSVAKPKILIVTVGVNGLSHWTEETFTAQYNRLLDLITAASPSTRIVLQSVYPTAKERDETLKTFTVDHVDRLNEWIRKLADTRHLLYLNTASVLKGEDGWLRPEYQNGDGLHLNTQGFNRVLEYVHQSLTEKGYL